MRLLPVFSCVFTSLLCYVMVGTVMDKFVFETVLQTQNWLNTMQGHFDETLFHFNRSFMSKDEKLILINDPQFGDVFSYTCPGCHVTYDKSTSAIADAVVFHCVTRRDSILGMPSQRSPNQRWVWSCAEPPWNTRYVFDKTLVNFHRVFNWTMTYRVDSDVYMPYSIDLSVAKSLSEVLAAKTSLAAWVSSNCAVAERSNTIRELQRSMKIDVFGKCGTKPLCPPPCQYDVLSRYKFYFAFENSRCKDYISEKFWRNGLGTGAVPVVIGPKRGDYELVAPPNSFIHVDDFQSLEALASYLNKLDKDDQLYGEYLRWKVGEFPGWSREIPTSRPYDEINALAESRKWGTHGICAICEKLKSNPKPSVVDRLDLFWYGSGYSPDSEQFSICSPKSGASGYPMKWILRVIYLFILVLLCAYFVFERLRHS